MIDIDISSAGLIGRTMSNVIGNYLYEKDPNIFQSNGLLSALEASKTKATTSNVRRLLSGKELYVISKPILNDSNEVVCIISCIIDVSKLEKKRGFIYEFYTTIGINMSSNFQNSIIAESELQKNAMFRAKRSSEFEVNVLITGESGSGKDVLAKYIHFNSSRWDKTLIQVNCSAIPENLLESELFGYEQGAFTGALRNGKVGLLELANRSTIFLDEIGDMPLSMQAKLLNCIQEKAFYRIGGTEKVEVDIRIIAATNSDLKQKVKDNLFSRVLKNSHPCSWT
jgi:transcriptional regulator with PAS, ATPase and Fis domain